MLSLEGNGESIWSGIPNEYPVIFDISMKKYKHPLYKLWLSIKRRCYNPSQVAWRRYGGRGITMCRRWKHNFENFAEDMGLPPSKDHSIERKDNNAGYSKSNCCWATRIEQGSNKRNNVWLEYKGRRQVAARWASELGVRNSLITKRIRMGWSPERVLFTPVSKRHAHNAHT